MELRMKKYTVDWDKLTNIGVRQYPRMVNRIRTGYKTDLDLDKLIVNQPPDDIRPKYVIQEEMLKERERGLASNRSNGAIVGSSGGGVHLFPTSFGDGGRDKAKENSLMDARVRLRIDQKRNRGKIF